MFIRAGGINYSLLVNIRLCIKFSKFLKMKCYCPLNMNCYCSSYTSPAHSFSLLLGYSYTFSYLVISFVLRFHPLSFKVQFSVLLTKSNLLPICMLQFHFLIAFPGIFYLPVFLDESKNSKMSSTLRNWIAPPTQSVRFL